ncbi:MAG TPA: DNA polymerase III subunit epsilon [Thermopetrobacter sp.]|nr:DNA polymerase III subunit epsilon [Thermopetrobacter sp.]
MREISLDTETTGFKPHEGHRIVEIGALELRNHVPTGEVFHVYLDPEREMPESAAKVHGLTDDFLRGKPKFADIANDFLAFIGDAPLVIHNAEFDRGFINWELKLAGLEAHVIPPERCIDTLLIARRKFPGAKASLDALCKRFGIDNSSRTFHGALLDAELLADVYLELVGGRQIGLSLAAGEDAGGPGGERPEGFAAARAGARPRPLPERLSEEARRAHEAFVQTLGENAIWKKYGL